MTLGADDVDPREAARQAELERISGQRQLALDAARLGWWHYDPVTRISDWDEGYRRIFGVAGYELPNDEILAQIIHPDDLPGLWAEVEAALDPADPKPFATEYRINRPDGETRWVEAHGIATFAGEGADRRAVSFVGTVADVTEGRLAREALRRALAKAEAGDRMLSALLENVPEGITIVDASGRLTMVSRRGQELLGAAHDGMSVDEVVAQWTVYQPDGVTTMPVEDLPIVRALRQGEPVQDVELVQVSEQGARLFLLCSAAPIRDAAGNIVAGIVAWRDISERRRAEVEARWTARRHELVSLAAARLLGSDHPQGLVEDLCVQVMEFLDCHVFFHFLVDQPARRLHLNACAGVPVEEARGIEPLDLDVTVSGCVARDGSPILVEDVGPVSDPRMDLVRSHGVRAYCCHPLTIKGQVVGTLSFGTRTRPRFSPDEVEVMRVVADLVAIAMHRVASENALRESEEKLRSSLANAAIGFALTTLDGRFLEANPAYSAITGYGIDELQRVAFLDLVHPDDRATNQRLVERMLEGEISSFVVENRYVRQGGGDVWVRKSVSLVRDAAGAARWITALVEDIAERKQAEDALRQSREDLDRAQAVGQVGSWRLDVTRNVLTWSDENYRIFGVPPGTPMSYDAFLEIVHPDDRRLVDDRWLAGLAGDPYDIEHRIVANGEVKWVREKAFLEFDAAGGLLGGFGITQDVTERKQAEDAIRASLEEKEVLLKEIHHRVKNNLQVIASLVNLQAGTIRNPAMDEVFQDVRDRVRTMALVHERLYQSDSLSEVAFADYASILLQQLWRSHGSAAAAVHLELELEPVALSIEQAVPLGLILNELATNALKHAFRGRPSGGVAVRLSQTAGGAVRLTVGDDGVGLPVGMDTATAQTLGLHLVQLLVEQLAGEVRVRSGAGTGTEFSVEFQAA